MMRRLGRRWKTLHRLIYVIVLLGIWHYYWQVKADVREPLVYLAIALVLLGWRVWKVRRAQRGERAGTVRSRERQITPSRDPAVRSGHIAVRIDHSSGKKRSSSALVRYDTPPVPPVPRL